MFGFLLNLLTVGLQSYTIYFLNSKYPETGQKVGEDIKGATGTDSGLELNEDSTAPGTENFQMGSSQSLDSEVHAIQPVTNESQSSQISSQNSPRDGPALSNPQAGDSSAPTSLSGSATVNS